MKFKKNLFTCFLLPTLFDCRALVWASIMLIAVVAEGFASATGSVIVYVFLVKEKFTLPAILVATTISKALIIVLEVIEVGLLLVVCVVVV